MPATQPQVNSITLAQYEALPEDKRVEVFDGVICDMASPSQAHQTISMELSTLIICDKNKLDGKRCNGAPDFIIELALPSMDITLICPSPR